MVAGALALHPLFKQPNLSSSPRILLSDLAGPVWYMAKDDSTMGSNAMFESFFFVFPFSLTWAIDETGRSPNGQHGHQHGQHENVDHPGSLRPTVLHSVGRSADRQCVRVQQDEIPKSIP
jgi:hypothetical protein